MNTAHIELRGDCYYVAGTRISLDSVVYAFLGGDSPETILEEFNGLDLAGVYGAIAYYLDHRADVDAYLRSREDKWLDAERRAQPPNPDLARRVAEARRAAVRA